MTPAPADLRAAVAAARDPLLGRSLGEAKMLKAVEADGDSVAVSVELPSVAYSPEARDAVENAVVAAVRQRRPDAAVSVTLTTSVRGKNSGGKVGLNVKNVVAVGSGKGGVGKSTVAACLAYGLKHFGAEVGLLDADVYGPSIPQMLGVAGPPGVIERVGPGGESVKRMVPIDAAGIPVLSMGFLVPADKAVIWRGPMLHQALTQFLQQTEWGDLDYLVIDLPPGTGDVSLTLSQLLGLSGAVVVCTPQKVARLDAVKAIAMYRQLHIPLLGVVENMSGDVFGRGGAKEMAAQQGVPFLGDVPIEAAIRVKGDEGRIGDLFADDSPARDPLLAVCRNIVAEIAREVTKPGAGPTLEIL